MARPCIFCGSYKDPTGEDVWPLWMCRSIAKHHGNLTWTIKTDRGIRTSPVVGAKINCVCLECNGGWMSTLEQAAKPFLEPMMLATEDSVTLSPDEQRIAARWAVKTAMCAEFWYESGRAFPNEHLSAFFASGEPAKNCAVWTGAIKSPFFKLDIATGKADLEVYGHFNEHGVRTPAHEAVRVVGVIAALRVGAAAFRVVTYDGPHVPMGRAKSGLPTEQDRLFRIWPPHDVPIVWPPKNVAMSDEQYREMATYAGDLFEPEAKS